MFVLILLLHTCGGVASGLGVLFLVPVGALAFLLPPRSALFLAAVAAIAILADTIWQQLGGTSRHQLVRHRRIAWRCAFTLLRGPRLSRRGACAKARPWSAKEMWISRIWRSYRNTSCSTLRESLLVVDAADKIRLINESAAEILGDNHAVPGALVGEVSPRLLLFLVDLATAGSRRRFAVELRRGGWRAGDSTAFCAARRRAGAHVDFPRRYQSYGRTCPARQACRARQVVRQHRSRNQKSGRRDEPCRPTSGRKRQYRTRTSDA